MRLELVADFLVCCLASFSTSTRQSFGLHFAKFLDYTDTYITPFIGTVWRGNLPDLLDLTLDDARYGIDSGRFTSVDLVTAYLRRIEEVQDRLHPILDINHEALSVAREMDNQRRSGNLLGQLHGIPVLIKGNMGSTELGNTGGSLAFRDAVVSDSATVLKKLQAAGAILLATTNLSELSNYRSLNSSNGWSAVAGQTLGPYVDNQDTSGSSSGSAVSMAVGLGVVAIGTETDGSIISPAEYAGVVGLKPTVGLVSRAGVMPISSHQDTVGPITKTVRDAALVLSIISCYDKPDNYTSLNSVSNSGLPTYESLCTKTQQHLNDSIIGVPVNLFLSAPPFLVTEFYDAVRTLESLGATVLNVTIPTWNESAARECERIVMSTDFHHDFNTFLASSLSNVSVSNLAELIKFIHGTNGERYPYFDTALLEVSRDSMIEYGSEKHWEAVQECRRIGSGIDSALDQIGASAMVLPTSYASHIAAIGGHPVLSVPMAYMPDDVEVKYSKTGGRLTQAPGIPVGLGLIGRKFNEDAIIRVGYAFEQATMIRTQRRPKIIPVTQIRDLYSRLRGLYHDVVRHFVDVC